MNRKAYLSILCIVFIAALAACGGGSTKVMPVETIAVTSGSGQSTVVSTAFTNPLVATVSMGGVANAGVAVTFTAPASGASGTFTSGSTTAMVTTDANGVATSPAFTANATTGGPYTVTAAAAGATASATFSLTNTAAAVASSHFAFYVTGEEQQGGEYDWFFYALAGSVIIDVNGKVLGGEQDYNNASGFTFQADAILSGTLTEDAGTGQGTLTLVTTDPNVGVNGTETLGVQFVNASHAQIIEFDANETSSGSLDLQTLSIVPSGSSSATPVMVSGNYAFAMSGIDPSYYSVGAGGVFSVTSGTLTGTLDANEAAGGMTTGIPFGATVSAPNGYGRGTITTSGIDGFFSVLTYYIIGPEAIRIIDMDDSDAAIGSAFGQGAGTFSDSSLGASVFSVGTNDSGNIYASAGQFTTSVAAVKQAVHTEGIPGATFSGVGDDDELGDIISNGAAISGQYTIGSNGYGSLSITNDGLGDGDISFLGIYMVDPAINISDPNNPNGGGGALVADLDSAFNGIGVLIPQTDPATASFQGDYSFIGQALTGCNGFGCEFDFLGQGSVDAGGLLTGSGFLNDPGFLIDGAQNSGVTFMGTFVPDGANVGRYTLFGGDSLAINLGSESVDFSGVAYQANGGQLLWIENNDENDSIFGGSLQQQNLPTPAAVKKAAVKAKPKQR